MVRTGLAAVALAVVLTCNAAAAQHEYLYVWTAGVDGQGDGSDKLVTVDVTRRSERYGKIVHTLSLGGRGELASLGLADEGRSLRAARASDGRVFEIDVGSDPSRPRLRRVSEGATAGDAPRQARDDRRVFVAGAQVRDDPDPVYFLRAYGRDGEAFTIAFEIDFRASRLGLPRAVVLLSR